MWTVAAELDVRCSARGGQRRCQLMVGHDASHAVMALIAGARAITTWGRLEPPGTITPDLASRYAWAPGFPTVAEDLPDRVDLAEVAALTGPVRPITATRARADALVLVRG
jgi:hypothetical protein